MRALIILSLSASVAFADSYTHPSEAKVKFPDGEKQLRAVRELLLKEYADENLDENDLYRGAIAGMLHAAGNRKWDELLSPAELADLETSLAGETVGIGIIMKVEPDLVTILRPVSGSPAERAGVRAGDRILKVDGRSLRGPHMDDVMRSIRGKPGDPVQLTILRDDDVVTVSIKRAPIVFPTVMRVSLPGGVELVQLRIFNEKTAPLLKSALRDIAGQKPRGVIVDLRENMGGLFDKLIDCASLFLPKGATIVEEVERGGHAKQVRSNGDPILSGVPIAVLADETTASSAELLAGALRDQLGARIVGGHTAGKWNVQKVEKLSNGWGIKYTIGVFRTAKGQSPDGKGIEPDVPVAMDAGAVEKAVVVTEPAARLQADAQLRAAIALLNR